MTPGEQWRASETKNPLKIKLYPDQLDISVTAQTTFNVSGLKRFASQFHVNSETRTPVDGAVTTVCLHRASAHASRLAKKKDPPPPTEIHVTI